MVIQIRQSISNFGIFAYEAPCWIIFASNINSLKEAIAHKDALQNPRWYIIQEYYE